MPSTILSDNGVSSGSAGLKTTAASDGSLALQTTTAGGTATTAVTIDTSQNVGVGVTPSYRLDVAQNNPTRGIVGQLQNLATSSQTGVQLEFLQNGVDYWSIGQPAGASAFAFWASRYNGADGTEVMRITNTGNLGVGTTSPSAKIASVSTSGYTLGLSGSTKGIRFEHSSTNSIINGVDNTLNASYQPLMVSGSIVQFGIASTEAARIDSNGNLLVGQTSGLGTNKLAVTGGIYFTNIPGISYNASSEATLGVFGCSNDTAVNSSAVYNIEWKMYGDASGQFWRANYIARGGSRTLGAYCTGTAWTNSSDIANKENVTSTEYGLSTVMASNPVDFQWKTMRDENGVGKKDIGFIAQEMELLVPEVVSGGEGDKGISYGNLVAVAFKAIQEQQAIITQLQADVAALKG